MLMNYIKTAEAAAYLNWYCFDVCYRASHVKNDDNSTGFQEYEDEYCTDKNTAR